MPCPLHIGFMISVTISARPRQLNCSGRDVHVAHLAGTCIREDHKKTIAPLAHHFSLRCSPDMEHTRLGTMRKVDRLSHAIRSACARSPSSQDRMGKSTLLRSDRGAGYRTRRRLLLFDPHGTLAEDCLAHRAPTRRNQKVCFSISPTGVTDRFQHLLPTCIRRPRIVGRRHCLRDVHSGATAGVRSWSASCALADRTARFARHVLSCTFLAFSLIRNFRARVVKRAKTGRKKRAFFEGQFASWPQDHRDLHQSRAQQGRGPFASTRRSACARQERSKLHFEHALTRPDRDRQTCQGIGRRQAAFLMGSLLLARAQAAIMGA